MANPIIVERDFCFFCSAEHYPVPCLNCGFRHCWKCRQTEGVTYSETPFSAGDGHYYCNTCDEMLRQESACNKLHEAFVTVRGLRDELINWQVRSDAAQKQVQQFLMLWRRRELKLPGTP